MVELLTQLDTPTTAARCEEACLKALRVGRAALCTGGASLFDCRCWCWCCCDLPLLFPHPPPPHLPPRRMQGRAALRLAARLASRQPASAALHPGHIRHHDWAVRAVAQAQAGCAPVCRAQGAGRGRPRGPLGARGSVLQVWVAGPAGGGDDEECELQAAAAEGALRRTSVRCLFDTSALRLALLLHTGAGRATWPWTPLQTCLRRGWRPPPPLRALCSTCTSSAAPGRRPTRCWWAWWKL